MKTISQFLDQSNRPVYSIDQCMQIMTDKHIRHLPIVNDTQVMGLISIGDVVREMIAYQKSMIEQLQSYIAGWQLSKRIPYIFFHSRHSE